MGLPSGVPPEAWNLTNPDRITQVHKAYFDAGAQVATTNSFGGNRLKLAAFHLDAQVHLINKTAVTLARSASNPTKNYVLGSMGPTGKLIGPPDNYTDSKLVEAFTPQVEGLLEGDVDGFLVETQYQLGEALAAVTAIKALTDKPIIVSMTFMKYKRGFFTITGDSPTSAFGALEDAGVCLLGANCSLGSHDMIDLVPALREATSLPIVVRPNAGLPAIEHGKAVYKQTPEEFLQDIIMIHDAGANCIGGCCGTTPGFIKKMADYFLR
jgi:5-methyltetrahydrofolate--homocysteine methyltransferase